MSKKTVIHITPDSRPTRIQAGDKWIDISTTNFDDFELLTNDVMKMTPNSGNVVYINVEE